MATETRILQGLVRRGVVTASDAGQMLQTLQVEDFQVREAEHFEPFGLTARPKDGAEAVVVRVGGTGHPVCLAAVDRRYRPTGLAKGDSCLYDAHGHRVHLSAAGVAVQGDTQVTGSVTASGSIAAGISVSAGATITAGGVVSAAGGAFAGAVACGSLMVGGVPIPQPGWSGTFLTGETPPRTVTVANGIVTGVS